MKKFLSLVLALVMTMSLVTISAGAEDFTDDASITYEEAVDVMSAVGVVGGYADGSFNPTAGLSRGAAAKIICNMILGPTTAAALSADTAPYKDVAIDNTYAGYIAYCAQQGIISGYADGTFRPYASLTGYAFMKMLLGALGYDASVEGYTGANWSIQVAKRALALGLDDGLEGEFVGTKALNREEACLYALNTLTARMVEYENSSTITVGDIVIKNNSVAKDVALGLNDSDRVFDTGYEEFAEKYFANLYRKVDAGNNEDAMMRPAHTWTVKRDVIGTYADTADYVFVVGKSQTAAKLIDDEISKKNIDAGVSVYVNGINPNPTAATTLKVGDIVEVFMKNDGSGDINVVVVTQYSADEVTGDIKIKNEGKEDEKVRIPGVIGYTATSDVIGYEGLVEDDIIYYYVDNDGVYHINKADYVEGKLTSVNNKAPLTYVVGDETYTVNGNCTTNGLESTDVVFNTLYRFYMDDNGYTVWGAPVEDELSDYVVIQDIAFVPDGAGIGNTEHVEARLVKMDGTTEVVTIDSIAVYIGDGVYTFTGVTTNPNATTLNSDAGTKGRYLVNNGALNTFVDTEYKDNTFFTYKIDSDGEYELTYVHGTNIVTGADSTVDLFGGKVSKAGTQFPVNDDTIFVVGQKASNYDNYKFDAYTGKFNVPDLDDAHVAYVKKDGIVTHMYIDTYLTSTFTGNSVFFLKNTPEAYFEVKNEDGTTYGYNTYIAIVNGEASTVKVAANEPAGTVAPSTAYNTNTGSTVAVGAFNPSYDDNGVVTNLTSVGAVDVGVVYGYKLIGTTLVTGKSGANYANAYVCESDVPVYIMDEDDNVTEGTAADIDKDANDQVYVVMTNTSGDNEAKYVVIIEKDSDETSYTLTVDGTAVTAFGTEANAKDSDGNTVTAASTTASNGQTIALTVAAGCTVKYETNAADWTLANTQVVSDGTPITMTHSSSGWTIIQIIAEDTTESVIVVK